MIYLFMGLVILFCVLYIVDLHAAFHEREEFWRAQCKKLNAEKSCREHVQLLNERINPTGHMLPCSNGCGRLTVNGGACAKCIDDFVNEREQ